ncbi:FIG015547: peptidase, M16 family [hydrothermal vent metagenome]|uniref:FIG015547: peptidase, M16 family n=1 Tax=hydrothermal vent metagenome TaxID=652676 RepID=A0A3B0YPR2_9ZZZZ
MKLLRIGIVMTLVWAMPTWSNGVHEFKLKNGLKLIVKEDHRSPVVVTQVWYKVGSSYETNGTSGVSHILEHMMFKGTRKLKPGEFSQIISANGGSENAFTGQDYTAYFQTFEKSRLLISFKHESDRMRNLVIINKEFQKERDVVIEERRLRTEDKPKSLTYERFKTVAFESSPYRIPVIGTMNDLQNMQVKDLERWYQRWYAPNNAVVVVVGDVNPKAVFKMAKKYFGKLKPSKVPPPKPQIEVPQSGIKRIQVQTPARLPFVILGYKVPVIKTAKAQWEPYAMEVLAWVLDGGSSARFEKELVRKQQVATSIGISYDPYARLGSLLRMQGTPAHKKTVRDLEKAIREQVNQLKIKLVSNKELERVKAQIVAQKVFQKDSMFYQGMNIGLLETVGHSWKLDNEFVKRINQVTPAQIQKLARKYLIEKRLTVATLKPLPLSMRKPRRRSAIKGGRHGR